MVQAKVNGNMTSLGADLTSPDVHKGYLTYGKSKVNSLVHDTGQNNVLLWEPCHNDNEDALPGAATMWSLISPTNKCNGQQLNNNHMKCYYDCTHGCSSDYFNDAIPDDAIIYTGNIPFQYNTVDGRDTEYIGNPGGTAFTVVKRNHELLLSPNKNNANMSSYSLNFGPHNTNQNCSTFVQVAFADMGDSSYHDQK